MNRTEALTSLMGIIIVITGAYFLYVALQPEYERYPGELTANIILIAGGALLALFLRKDLRRSTVLAMITIALSTIAGSVYYIFYTDESMQIILSNVFVILSVVLIYYSISLIFNTTAGNTKGLICLGVLALVQLAPIVYKLYMGADPIELVKDNVDRVVRGSSFLIVIFILTRKDMALENLPRRMDRNSTYLYSEEATSPNAFIDKRDFEKLIDIPKDGWKICKFGPVDSEYIIPLYNTSSSLRLQKWKAGGDIQMAVCSGDGESYTVSMTIPMRSVVLDDPDRNKASKIRVYGDDGVFVDLLIRDLEDLPKGYIENYRYNKRKARARKKKKK